MFGVQPSIALLGKGGLFLIMINIKQNVPLAPYTVYKVGGSARYFTEIKEPGELTGALSFAKENGTPFFVLGAGSNILVSDKGYNGLVIHLSMGGLEIRGTTAKAGAALSMASVVAKTAQAGLSGFEWAIGVPGTIGGSVRGNAGCFGKEMKDVVQSVQFLDTATGEQKEFSNKQCEFAYRDSIFKKHPEWIIVCAALGLADGNSKEIQERIKNITLDRTKKQDIGTKSCGCIFKNVPWDRKDIDKEAILARFPDMPSSGTVEGIPVSYLLDHAGLKGRRVGRVSVSPKHANFFVNEGGATAEEVVMLISIAKDAVKRKFGIVLEEEIQYVGF